MPRYGGITAEHERLAETGRSVSVTLGSRTETFSIAELWLCGKVRVLLLDNPRLFGDARVYIDERDRERFFFFSRAVLDALPAAGCQPDILHCNDWHTGMAVAWHRRARDHGDWSPARASVFTIHNLAHQGVTDIAYAREFGYDPGPQLEVERGRYPDTINVMARAIAGADLVTTVSPRYAREILTPEFGAGLDPLLRQRSDDLVGILNGIDLAAYDPSTDAHIAERYAVDDIAGKSVCKQRLQEEAGLMVEPSAPLIGLVSRLDDQKGFDLLTASVDRVIEAGAEVVLLGTGDGRYHSALSEAAARHPGRVGVFLGFDEGRARRIYAGSDMFLMPSRFEPCGLGQMIAMRYGTIPIVRRTGGLADTVPEWDPSLGSGVGFGFDDYDVDAMLGTIHRALAAFRSPDECQTLIRNAMTRDLSWARSAGAYLEAYDAALQAA